MAWVLLLQSMAVATSASANVHVIAACSNKTDCTQEFQGALDSCASVVHVPVLPGRSWIVRPIHVTCDDQTIEFAAGVVLQAKRGEFHKGEERQLFTVKNRSDVTIRGGHGATFRMWRHDYANATLYNHSEARHGIALYGSRNIRLEGMTVTETGGDGVYISNILGKLGTPNYNITMCVCICC